MLEWLIPVIAGNIFGYMLNQSGLGEQIRSKFKHDLTKDAIQRSLEKIFERFERLHPQLAAEDLFRQSFQDVTCTSILAQLLLRDGKHYPDALAKLWADILYKDQPAQYAAALRMFEPIAVDFLNSFDNTLRTEPVLREIHDSQALERTASSLTDLSSDFHAFLNRHTVSQLSDDDVHKQSQQYCKKIYEQGKMLDFKGIQYTDSNRPVSIPLIEVFVLPEVLVGMPEYETLERDEIQKQDEIEKERQEKSQENEASPISYPW